MHCASIALTIVVTTVAMENALGWRILPEKGWAGNRKFR
jgi:hypothetical protein